MGGPFRIDVTTQPLLFFSTHQIGRRRSADDNVFVEYTQITVGDHQSTHLHYEPRGLTG